MYFTFAIYTTTPLRPNDDPRGTKVLGNQLNTDIFISQP